ncbi:hypothetical protein DOTSEDRAFT_59757 [Dothistroma septosporum NZE10]|uniref:D-isomer specific 2-hydroxyacid dehydrogenase NAD-binding domain-containing protein n=1 Tax=Dothistroma septosporum (strain NZE10 / CBS 128990) TaxID=675120 RepID=N1PUX8_DOTSN|nr:hypothetical protein DOTSEDRAFT_59757 [Dothistroma septosporum NZE10]
MGTRADILLIASSIQAVDHERRQHKVGKFANLRPFTVDTVAHFPPSLKIICCSGHVYDAADTVALAERGIWYCNTPNACTEAVANAATYLNLNRELGLEATDSQGKALGIVGLGDIGTSIARKCEAVYGMEIHYCGPRRKRGNEELHSHGARYHPSVEAMIPAIDCIILAAPYTSETHHMLSKYQFRLAKPSGLRIVNIARGSRIDEEALLEALESKQVVGVGLDVHEHEPVVNEKLRSNHKVTLLPHIGVCSLTSWINFETQCWDNLAAFFETGTLLTPVHTLTG